MVFFISTYRKLLCWQLTINLFAYVKLYSRYYAKGHLIQSLEYLNLALREISMIATTQILWIWKWHVLFEVIQTLEWFCYYIYRTELLNMWYHYGNVIMGAIASLITSLTIVYSTVYSDADQRKHQSSASLAFARGIHRVPVNYPHKWLVMRKMFPFDDVIMSLRISCELKSRETPFARNLQFSSLPVVYFRTGHGSRTAILCAKFHNDLETDKYVMGKREFTVFISKQITLSW